MPPDTRQSMVLAAVELLRERGVDGVTLDDVLSRSGAPEAPSTTTFRMDVPRSSTRPRSSAAMPSPG